MKHETTDPRIERLVSLLYGELPEAEALALRAEIENDPALRAEWEELTAARTFLSSWEVPGDSPGFVFVNEPAIVPRRGTGGVRERLRGLVPVWSWGVAATAVAVLVLAVGGFRVEKVDQGLAFRFGHEKSQGPKVAEIIEPGGVRGVPLTSPPVQQVSTEPIASESAAPKQVPAGAAPYLTKEEFQAYAAGMTQTMAALLNEYGRQRDQEVGSALQVVLKSISDRQTEDYRDLRGRFDAFASGLTQEQMTTKAQLGYLLEQTRSTSPGSVHPAPAIETKGD